MVLHGLHICLLTGLLAIWALPNIPKTQLSLATASICLFLSSICAYLSHQTHRRSRRPGDLVAVYLTVSAAVNAVRVRTLWLLRDSLGLAIPCLLMSVLATEVAIVLVESQRLPGSAYADDNPKASVLPQEVNGVFSQRFFFWLNPLLWRGYRQRTLAMGDLFPLDRALRHQEPARQYLSKVATAVRTGVPSSSSASACKMLLSTFRWSLAHPVLPRLLQLTVTILQPFLLQQVTEYLSRNTNDERAPSQLGMVLAVAYTLLYIILGISTAWYWHLVDRSIIQIRGVLIGAICERASELAFRRMSIKDDKATSTPVSTSYGNSSGGSGGSDSDSDSDSKSKSTDGGSEASRDEGSRVVTLVAGDVEKAIAGLECCHELWANAIQATVALVLIYQNIGIVFLVPLGILIIAGSLSWYIAQVSPRRQAPCMEAMESRLEATTSFLDSFRSLRLMSLTGVMADWVQSKRQKELKLLRHYRYMTISAITVSYLPTILGPTVAFTVLQATRPGLMAGYSRVFMSLTLLNLLAEPLVYAFQLAPYLAFSFVCLGRVQDFLFSGPHSTEPSTTTNPTSFPVTTEEHELQDYRDSARTVVLETEEQGNIISDADSADDDEAAEQAKSQEEMLKVGEWAIIRFYFRAAGCRWLLPFLGSSVAFIALNRCSEIVLKYWAQASQQGDFSTVEMREAQYWIMQIVSLLCLVASTWILLQRCVPTAGSRLHRRLLTALSGGSYDMVTRMNHGAIVNRFTQDFNIIDGELTRHFSNVVQEGIAVITQLALVLVASPYLAAVVPFLGGTLYVLQKCYLATTRPLRLLELSSRAPLCSQILEMLDGPFSKVATTRPDGRIQRRIRLNQLHRVIEDTQRPIYLFFCAKRWLSLVLDLIVAGIATLVVAIAVSMRGRIDAGFVSVALVNIMGLSQSMRSLVLAWTDMGTALGSLLRIRQFEKDLLQGCNTTAQNEKNMPEAGRITSSGRLGNVKVNQEGSTELNERDGYAVEFCNADVLSLNDFSLAIPMGAKVAIHGGSESDRSAILLSLARLHAVNAGVLRVNGHDIYGLDQDAFGRLLTIITPDAPIVPEKTIKEHVDPFGQASDTVIIGSLRRVGLWDGLLRDASLNDLLPSSIFSKEQRQLLALAQALLRPARILVLQEVPGYGDSASTASVQSVIRDEFGSFTIIEVAEKPSRFTQYDREIMLGKGITSC